MPGGSFERAAHASRSCPRTCNRNTLKPARLSGCSATVPTSGASRCWSGNLQNQHVSELPNDPEDENLPAAPHLVLDGGDELDFAFLPCTGQPSAIHKRAGHIRCASGIESR